MHGGFPTSYLIAKVPQRLSAADQKISVLKRFKVKQILIKASSALGPLIVTAITKHALCFVAWHGSITGREKYHRQVHIIE